MSEAIYCININVSFGLRETMNRKKFPCYLLIVDLHLHFALANLILPEWLLPLESLFKMKL